MADLVRVLNDSGIGEFIQYLGQVRAGSTAPAPRQLLTDSATSLPIEAVCSVEDRPFADRFELGSYLGGALEPAGRRAISRNHGLWTWIALYYFDQLCPRRPDGTRAVRADEVYVLPANYDFESYYRHLVRTPWLSVLDHGEFAKVLLIPASARSNKAAGLATRGEIVEQLASRQFIFGNQRIIEAAYSLYFDTEAGRPFKDVTGGGTGSPRRLAMVLQQLDLTHDLGACQAENLIQLLPGEFNRWRRAA